MDFEIGRAAHDGRVPSLRGAGGGILRIALLFGLGAIALALLVTPYVDNQVQSRIARSAAPLDFISTGTVRNSGTYTIRRSILQASPRSVCIIRDNGTRSGDC
jgi:hypothetical protein